MDGINFKSLMILENAPGKKFLKKLVEEAFRLRKVLKSFTEEHKSPLLNSIAESLEISEQQSQEVSHSVQLSHPTQMLVNLSKLITETTKAKF